jgi:hypothetical protein
MRTLVFSLLLVIGNGVVLVEAAEAKTPAPGAEPQESTKPLTITAPAKSATAEAATSWSLAVPWKALATTPLPPSATAPLPPSKELSKAYSDPGISAAASAAVATAFDDHAWISHQVPGMWENYSVGWELDGEAVFRLSIELPASAAGKDLIMGLGVIDDFDETFFNGKSVGRVDKNVLGYWTVERVYRIPGQLVVAGPNVIAVRIFDRIGGGGFIGPRTKMNLRLAGKDD